MENAWDLIKSFLSLTGLELNANKTVFLRNHKAHQANAKARMKLGDNKGKVRATQCSIQILGVWFTMDGDWSKHKELT
jgi:hypothetical protein